MKKKIRWKPYIISTIISVLIGIAIFLPIYLVKKTEYSALNAVSLAGIVLISFGGLSYVAREGFFDFASYGFKQLGSMIFGKTPNAYNNFAGYKEYKMERRKAVSHFYIPFLIVGALFFVAYLFIRLF